MATGMRAITVFCGASLGDDPRYEENARRKQFLSIILIVSMCTIASDYIRIAATF